jgi:hypothetical protein
VSRGLTRPYSPPRKSPACEHQGGTLCTFGILPYLAISKATATATTAARISVEHPAAAPSFRCLPDLVSGMPIFLDILDFAADMPVSLFHEKPPLFTERTSHL